MIWQMFSQLDCKSLWNFQNDFFYQGRTSPFICQKVPEFSILRSLMRAIRPAALSGGSIRPLCPVISKIFFTITQKYPVKLTSSDVSWMQNTNGDSFFFQIDWKRFSHSINCTFGHSITVHTPWTVVFDRTHSKFGKIKFFIMKPQY